MDLRLQRSILKEAWLTSRYVLLANYLQKQSAFEKTKFVPKFQGAMIDFSKRKKIKRCIVVLQQMLL